MKNYQYYIFFVLLTIFISCKATLNEANGASSTKPNIIFIMSDDQGYADLGCYGSEFVETPYLDQMAAEGMRFTQVYAGSPVCAPTRCVLLTGLHSGHTTRRDNRTTDDINKPFMKRKLIPLKSEDYTIGELMQDAGYTTGAFGKWGLGNPGTSGAPYLQGFDEFYGYIDQVHAHEHYTEYLMHNSDTIPVPGNLNGQRKAYAPDLIAEKGLDFIRDNQENPFFLYLPYTPPHGKYEVPDNSLYADQPWSEKVKNYAAMISRMDGDIGALFSLLEDLELDENTIVFFTSDHGPNPPFLKDLKSNMPLLPTLLGEQQMAHEFLYWEYHSPFQQAVRIDDWKGIRLGTKEEVHLFNLSKDIEEQHNVAADNLEIVRKIEIVMEREHRPNPYWPIVENAISNSIFEK